MRIHNIPALTDHGNINGRKDMVKILESAFSAADPYTNARLLLKRQDNLLYVGHPDFEASQDPQAGVTVIDLHDVDNVYIVGAGKGSHHVVRALEETLGDALSGGELICKYGDNAHLRKVHVTYGAHPVPDRNCVAGCRRILKLADRVTQRDVVFTVIANGGSSLLTLPFDGIPLEDVQRLVHMMQIEKGVSTMELNAVRNHLDRMKGGRISRAFSKAQLIHIVVTDANHPIIQHPVGNYMTLMRENLWLHNLPDGTTFGQAVEVLQRHGAWDACPLSIRKCLLRADAAQETVKYEEFQNMRFRVFGIMPDRYHFLPVAAKTAESLGYRAVTVSESIHFEAAQMGYLAGSVAWNMEKRGEPFAGPVALFSTGELLVTVGKHTGVGGRNQEFALASASQINGLRRVVIAAIDTDGTDGPGGMRLEGAPHCLAGAIVDGDTLRRAVQMGIDIHDSLARHDVSAALWRLGDGIHAEQNISLADLMVVLLQ